MKLKLLKPTKIGTKFIQYETNTEYFKALYTTLHASIDQWSLIHQEDQREETRIGGPELREYQNNYLVLLSIIFFSILGVFQEGPVVAVACSAVQTSS